MIFLRLKLAEMAECVTPSPTLPQRERGQTNRYASLAFNDALKAVMKKFLP